MSHSFSKLFEPTEIGRHVAKNRIFMAPMSRYRAPDRDIPPDLTQTYYRQRAGAGLIVAESTKINAWAGGTNCPGIYADEQVDAWKKVTEGVHAEGGLIFLQLWHSGRAAHQSLMPEGQHVSAPSALGSQTEVMTANGMEVPTVPRALTLEQIVELRADYATASRNALKAGFDGVEIHAAGGFLIDSFLQAPTNLRKDDYGGPLENRFRFLGEVLDDATEIWGADRVGIKLSPTSDYNDMGEGDVLETFTYVIEQLNTYGLAFLEVNEEMPMTEASAGNRAILDRLQALWTGPYIANGNYDATSGDKRILDGKADAITFGRLFIANPDLPARFANGGLFNELDPQTFYGGDHRGYTDYPVLQKISDVAA
ncbi:MAG: alkene reductase [Pseudomonadota bacterium]